jgi:hypothetical protein
MGGGAWRQEGTYLSSGFGFCFSGTRLASFTSVSQGVSVINDINKLMFGY